MALRIKREEMYGVLTFDPFTAQDILHNDLSGVRCENMPPKGSMGRILVNVAKLPRKNYDELYDKYYKDDAEALSDAEWKDTLFDSCGLIMGFFDYVADSHGLKIRQAKFSEHCYRIEKDGRIVQEEEEED